MYYIVLRLSTLMFVPISKSLQNALENLSKETGEPISHLISSALSRGLRHGLPHNQLKNRLDRNLGVVPLHESIRPFQDARLRIRKVVLGLRLWLRSLAIFTLALGLLARSLFQRFLAS